MSIFKDIYTLAQDCGYSGLSYNETYEAVINCYPNFVSVLSKEDWDNIEIAYINGRAEFLMDTETVFVGHC